MSSENKRKKMKNSYFVASILKNRIARMKRCYFYTASDRQENKKIDNDDDTRTT